MAGFPPSAFFAQPPVAPGTRRINGDRAAASEDEENCNVPYPLLILMGDWCGPQ
jgi:hypothetical protein